MFLASFARDDICFEARKLWIVPSVSEKEGRRIYYVKEDEKVSKMTQTNLKVNEKSKLNLMQERICTRCRKGGVMPHIICNRYLTKQPPRSESEIETRLERPESRELCQCDRCKECEKWVLHGRWSDQNTRQNSGLPWDRRDKDCMRSDRSSVTRTRSQNSLDIRKRRRCRSKACKGSHESEECRTDKGTDSPTSFKNSKAISYRKQPCLATEVPYSQCLRYSTRERRRGERFSLEQSAQGVDKNYQRGARIYQNIDYALRSLPHGHGAVQACDPVNRPGQTQPVRTVVTLQPGAINTSLCRKDGSNENGRSQAERVPNLPNKLSLQKGALLSQRRGSLTSVASTSLAYSLCWKCFADSGSDDGDYTSTTSEEEGSDSDGGSEGGCEQYDIQQNSDVSAISISDGSSGGSDSRDSAEDMGGLASDNSSLYEEDIMVQEALLFGENTMFGSNEDMQFDGGGGNLFENDTISDSDEYFGDTDDEDAVLNRKGGDGGESVCCKSIKSVNSI